MPRPTSAQLAYGCATVVCSTLAMLLLSRTTTGIGVAVIGMAALALGLLVALTVPRPGRTGTARAIRADRSGASGEATESRGPAARSHAGAEARVGQHSLRR
ncbi:hypothetical protein [Streptomyces sp. AK02-01A]|uniref:hypothetical protein n=1 Tax=Streptomyces sp. AK02-01A TaxID=3028648 RepID=UPI0029A6BCE8|nr:hypothetical protein [Streptomyces sp. AK02-01A]MDX3849112.1 hypothetical protein [Streptomyces sp. AK02-01A]